MKRHRFRPQPLETMEERIVMSHAVVHVAARPQTLMASGYKVGALGDSYTDEYRFYGPDRSQARNWVEILAATRHVNFGAFSEARRAAPRNAGFANNWAESGATTNAMVSDQLPGLANEVRRGQVNTAAIFIGGDDFLDALQEYSSPLTAPSTPFATTISQVESNAENNMTTAVQTLLNANLSAKLVLYTVPDVTTLPEVQTFANFAGASTLLSETSAAVAQYNAHIEALASGNGRIAVVDLASQLTTLQQQTVASGSLNVGGTMIDMRTPGDAYNHFYLADGLHLGTVGQAGIANDFIQAIDTQFHANVKQLTAAEVLKVATRLPSR